MTTPWQAHPQCPTDARNKLQNIIQALPAVYLSPPQDGEEFDGEDSCIHRLQGYALNKEFAVVKTSGSASSSSKRVRVQFRCIYHDVETKNNRQLELHVERDSESKILTQRQRDDTHTQQKSCPWAIYLSLQKIRGTAQKALLLSIQNVKHSHLMAIIHCRSASE